MAHDDPPWPSRPGPLALADWRRRVGELYAEVRGEPDRLAARARWRAGRDALLAGHPESPLPPERRAGAAAPCWPYDPGFAFTAPLEPAQERPADAPASVGDPCPLRLVGTVDLPIGRLEVYWVDVYGGGLLLPLADATSGRATYGGGRYVLDTCKGADLGQTAAGELVVDLNFAYHPSCFYDPRWSCPLPPAANRLDAEVAAGERMPEGRAAG